MSRIKQGFIKKASFVYVLIVANSSELYATAYTWNSATATTWNNDANWTPNTGFPNAIGDSASFGSIITANRTFTLGQNITLGTLHIDSAHNLTYSGNTLTFQVASGNAAINVTDVNGNGSHTISSATVLNSPLQFSQGSTGTFTYSGVISGTSSLTFLGPDTLSLTAANSFSGGTTISAGTLSLTGSGSLLPAGAVAVNGTFNISGISSTTTIGDLTGSGIINLGAKNLKAGTANSTTFSGVIEGTGGVFTKAGSGELTLTGANNYTGNTSVTAGTLAIGAGGSLYTSGTVTVATGATFDISATSTTIGTLNGSSGSFVNLGAQTLNVGAGTFTGLLEGAGGKLLKTGTGTLILNGTSANTYSGGTTINGGILETHSGSTGTGPITFSGNSTFDSLTNQTLSHGPITIDTGVTATLTGAANVVTSLSTTISGTSCTLDINSATVEFNNDSSATFSGSAINLNTGTLVINSNGALGDYTNTINLVSGNSNIEFPASGFTVPQNINIGTGLTLNSRSYGNVITDNIISGLISGGGTFQANFNKSIINLTNNNNSYTGGTQIGDESGIQISSGTQLSTGTINITTSLGGYLITDGDFTLSNPIVYSNTGLRLVPVTGTTVTLSGPITGINSIFINQQSFIEHDISGTGTVVLTNLTNNIQGVYSLSNGTLSISSPYNLCNPATPSLLTFELGCKTGNQIYSMPTLEITGTMDFPFAFDLVSTFDPGYSNLNVTAGNTCNFSGLFEGTSPLILNGPGTAIFSGSSSTYSGSLYLDNGILSISNYSNNLGTASLAFGGGALQLTGSTTITGAVTFPGNGTIIPNAGTSSTISSSMSGPGGLMLDGPGSLTLTGSNSYAGGTTLTDGTLIGTAANNSIQGNILDNSSLIFTDNSTGTYAGSISGSGDVTMAGSGNLVFSGANTYTGPTVVESGALLVNGSIVSPTTVDAGALIGGTGNTGFLDIFGTLTPGNPLSSSSIGTITTGSVIFEPGSTYAIEIMGSTGDLTIADGSVTIDPGSTLSVCPMNLTLNEYTVIASSGPLTGQFSNIVNPCARIALTAFYFPNDLVLAFQNVPFPSIVPKGNLRNIAVCFQEMTNDPSADLISVLEVLDTLSTQQMIAAFNQFDPSMFNTVNFAEQSAAERIRQLYTDHTNQRISFYFDEGQLPWRVWSAFFGEESHLIPEGSYSSWSGYRDQFLGGLVGVDRLLTPSLLVSTGFSYTNSWIDSIGAPTRSHFKSYTGSLAAAWRDLNIPLRSDAYFGFTYHRVDSTRNVYIEPQQMMSLPLPSPIIRNIDHTLNSYTFTGHLGVTYDQFQFIPFNGECIIYPFVNLDYLYNLQNSFKETNGGSLALQVQNYQTDLLRREVGIGISYLLVLGAYTFETDASLSYVGEFRFKGKTLNASFTESPDCVFQVNGILPTTNLISPFFQLGISSPHMNLSLHANYRGNYGAHFQESQGSIELRYAW